MNFDDSVTLYDILDVSPDASSQEIREAYIRTKATFNRDSIALYTLIDSDAREIALRHIEDAYFILSNTEKRREYDEKFSFLSSQENPFSSIQVSIEDDIASLSEVSSIDRFPPMESLSDEDNILIPPATDFQIQAQYSEPPLVKSPHPQSSFVHPEKKAENFISALPSPASSRALKYPSIAKTSNVSRFKEYSSRIHALRSFPSLAGSRARLPELSADMVQAIENEKEWSGHFLRQIRDAYKISLEEMAGITKITKNYLIAIEEERFDKLPASVYTRGFVMQIAKVLKLPYEKVTVAYLARCQPPGKLR